PVWASSRSFGCFLKRQEDGRSGVAFLPKLQPPVSSMDTSDEAASLARPPSRFHLGNPPSITSSSHRRSSKVVTFFAMNSQLFVEASKANATTRQPPAISTTSERGKRGGGDQR
ncbi:hypothetical protein U1Q18_023298, partial [Sarracenia purpurea var. burkii]